MLRIERRRHSLSMSIERRRSSSSRGGSSSSCGRRGAASREEVLRVVVAHQAFEQRVCEHFLVHLWGKCEQMEWIKRHFSSTLSLSIDRNHGIIIIIRVYFFVVFVASGERFQWKSIFAFKETRFFVFFFFFLLSSYLDKSERQPLLAVGNL